MTCLCVSWHLLISRRRRQWHPTPLLLPGKSHEWRSLVDCSPWGREESDMTEWLHFDFSLSCIGEGNGNHSSVLAWRIPGTGEPIGLPSLGSHRVGHDWNDLAAVSSLISRSTYLNMVTFTCDIFLQRESVFASTFWRHFESGTTKFKAWASLDDYHNAGHSCKSILFHLYS